MAQANCERCGRRVEYNPYTYAPPVTNHPLLDTAFYKDGYGWVCVECIPQSWWDEEDARTLAWDWGIEVTRVEGRAQPAPGG